MKIIENNKEIIDFKNFITLKIKKIFQTYWSMIKALKKKLMNNQGSY